MHLYTEQLIFKFVYSYHFADNLNESCIFLSASCTLVVVYSTTVDNLFTGVTFQKVNTDNLPTHLPLNTEITGGTKEIELVGAKNIKITDSFCP